MVVVWCDPTVHSFSSKKKKKKKKMNHPPPPRTNYGAIATRSNSCHIWGFQMTKPVENGRTFAPMPE
jgi:hypothetical protein